MKKLLMLAVAAFAAGSAAAQMNQPIPADPEVRTGKLENGMTYYIRHNEKPKGQADFYILHDVGAIQENDSQQGLAHFLEHMAFNGTKNLPGKQLTEYLETAGVKFGANLNAGTSWDRFSDFAGSGTIWYDSAGNVISSPFGSSGMGSSGFTNPVAILGTVIIVIGVVMLIAGVILAVYLKKRGNTK